MTNSTIRLLMAGVTVAFSAVTASAIPAKPGIVDVATPDGSKITVRLVGDESFHMCFTEDGIPLAENGGYYYYGRVTADGNLVSSGIRAANPGERDAVAREWILKNGGRAPQSIFEAYRELATGAGAVKCFNAPPRREARRQAASAVAQGAPGATSGGFAQGPGLVPGSTFPLTGHQKGLVILVEYSDVKFQTENANDYFYRMLNEKGFADLGATGSARDFYEECSGGLFLPEFDVLGPVTLPETMNYYGGNDVWGNDQRPFRMAIDACEILDKDVDFSQYDRDGDGYIDNVFIFYAGRGEASGGTPDTVWPHAWYVSGGTSKVYEYDGVILDRYACSNEWEFNRETEVYRPDGVGTFVHEFSHVMGLPDIYATTYVDSFTPDSWSCMDYGPYNNDGMTPPAYGAYERYALGWMRPTVINRAANVTLPPIEENKAGIIHTDNFNEFFLLENRQPSGWDAYLPGHGMLVWHIQYSESVWTNNAVNNKPEHQYVDIEEADGILTEETRDGDSFPGAAGITSFTDDTTPSMRTWDDKPMNLPLTEIAETPDGMVTFKVAGGAAPLVATTAHEAEAVNPIGFTARWDAVPGLNHLINVFARQGGERVPAEGYDRLDVGECGSYDVTGLSPETEYFFTVAVTDGWETGAESNEVAVTTLAGSLPFDKVKALEASEVGENSFVARWERLERADDYELSVYRKVPGAPIEVECGFDGGVFPLPEGWSAAQHNEISEEGYFGEAAPAIRFEKGTDYIRTPTFYDGIKSFSFWHRGKNTGDYDQILLVAGTPGGAVTLGMVPVVADEGGSIYENNSLPENTQYVRVEFVTFGGKGVLAIDDIRLTHGHSLDNEAVAPYDSFRTGDTDSWKVEGLDADSEYYFAVRGTKGGEQSFMSDEVFVRTATEGSGVATVAPEGVTISVAGRTVTASQPVRMTVYDAYGICRATGEGSVTLDAPGLYLVTLPASGRSLKVFLR